MEIKTTRQIINDELGVILISVDYDVNNSLFETNKNKKWISVNSLFEFFENFTKLDKQDLIDYLDEKNNNPTNIGIKKQEV